MIMLFNKRMVWHIMGFLLILEAVLMLPSTVVGLFCREPDGLVFAGVMLFTAISGLLAIKLSHPTQTTLGRRDGYLLTAVIWAIFSVFGMIPFAAGSLHLSLADSYFEAMSGFTTTGATVLRNPEYAPKSILLWRSMMQWIGGLGIILLTLALVPGNSVGGSVKLFHAEVTGVTHDKLLPRVSQTAKRMWLIYIALTIAVILLLWAGPMNFFEALCQGLSTISTGGFSTSSESIAHWNTLWTKVVMTVFMFIGGINFALIYRMFNGHPRDLWRSDVFRTFVSVVLCVTAVFGVAMWRSGRYSSVGDLFIDPVFQAVSVITSSGFSCGNYQAWGMVVIAVMCGMMFSGACAGSTSGGAKMDRILVAVKNMYNELYRFLHPNSVRSVRINGRVVPPESVHRVMAFLGIYLALVAIGVFTLTWFDVRFGDAVFTSFSCVGNMGVGYGITGPEGSFALLPDPAKWILALLMLIGRLEIFTVLILFTRDFWHR